MKNKKLKKKFIFFSLMLCIMFNVSLNASTDHLAHTDYGQSITAEMTHRDIHNFNSDVANIIFPTIENNNEQVVHLFGGNENFIDFYAYIIYGTCMLTAIGTDMNAITKQISECGTKYAHQIIDITHIIQKIQENGDNVLYAEMKDFVNAIFRTYNFFIKHRKLFPHIDRVMSIALLPKDLSIFTDHLSYANYLEVITAKATVRHINRFNSDLANIIFPMIENNSEQVSRLFGGQKNYSDFYAYITYVVCMLNTVNLNEETIVKKTGECGALYSYQLADITNIIQIVRENSEKETYADMKNFANAIVRVHNFFIKYKSLFPAIDIRFISSHRDEL